MADKSPRQGMTTKSGKSLKEKRADKRAAGNTASGTETLMNGKKKH